MRTNYGGTHLVGGSHPLPSDQTPTHPPIVDRMTGMCKT